MTAHALHSLYGGKTNRRALAGNVGVQVRVQEVHTPLWILDAVREAFGGEISYDPCAASNPKNWFAKHNETLPPAAMKLVRALGCAETKEEKRGLKKKLKPYYLALPPSPMDRTFINPPFDFLEPWMKFFWSGYPDARVVQLTPVRTHRKWWTKYAAGANGVWLAPFPFVGQKQAFPAPVCLLSRNCEIPPLGKMETGRFKL